MVAAANRRRFEFDPITSCSPAGRSSQTVAADLDGTLLISTTSLPYFLLVALKAGTALRAIILLSFLPFLYSIRLFVSESLAIQALIFVALAGLRIRDIEAVAASVLPRLYAEDVHPDAWRVFSSCGRRCIVTACPRVMTEHFGRNYLRADKVLGTELETTPSGRATGFVKRPGVLIGRRKRMAVVEEFGEDSPPDLGIGDRESDHDFMSICKEAYIVPRSRTTKPLPSSKLLSPVTFLEDPLLKTTGLLSHYCF